MSTSPPDALSTDETYELAAKQSRRDTLRLLLTERKEWMVDDLARAVAAREHETSPAAIDKKPHTHAALTLVHRDLPKLDAADVVAFDVEGKTVTPGANIDAFDGLL